MTSFNHEIVGSNERAKKIGSSSKGVEKKNHSEHLCKKMFTFYCITVQLRDVKQV